MSSLESALEEREFLVGDALTGADVQVQYVVDSAIRFGMLGDRPRLVAYNDRLMRRPAYLCAVEKGGPAMLPHR